MEKMKCKSYFGDYKCHVATNVKDSKGNFIHVDKCLKDAVENLNAQGFKTVASCCGHGIINPKITIEDLSDGKDVNTSESGLNIPCVSGSLPILKAKIAASVYLKYRNELNLSLADCDNVIDFILNEYMT